MRRIALAAMLSATVACATGPGPQGPLGPGASTRPSRSQNVLTGLEILERAPSAATAFQAIQQLRNSWVRRPVGTRSLQGATSIRIYIDNVVVNADPSSDLTSPDVGGVEVLASYPVEQIYELRYYNARDATQRWGTGHAGGAIEVISGTPGVARGVREEPPRERRQTMGPFVPFSPGFTSFLHSGRSTVTRPEEVSQVWESNLNYGAGFGIQATRNVTLFAALEVNRLQFSPEGTLSYFMSRPLRRLVSTEGVEVAGEPSTILNVSANLKIHPAGGIVRPYLVGGLGYSRFTAGAFTVSGPGGTALPRSQFGLQIANGGDQVENGFSIAGGVGFEIAPPGRFRLFADGRYVTALRGPRYRDAYDRFQLFNTTYYPVRVGISYH